MPWMTTEAICGGQADFGYVYPATNGELQLTSLKNLDCCKDKILPMSEYQSFKDMFFFR